MSFDPDLYRRTVRLEGRGQDGAPLTMSVIDAGPRDSLRTLVFLHGMGGYAGYWRHQLNYFYEGSRVIAPDLRGHGLSDAPNSVYDCEELLGDIDALLSALDVPENFILIAHSFGGALATLFTCRHPERVQRLVLIGSAARFDKLNNVGRFLLKMPAWLISTTLRLLPVGKRYPPGHVVHAQYHHALRVYNGTPYLQAIQCPCLVILGERDRLFDSSQYQAIAKLIPNAQEVTMPQSAHQVMVERPDAVNRALDRFLGPVQFEIERQLRRDRQKALEVARPWLKFYDGRTPYQIRPPQGPVQRHLEIAAKRFAETDALRYFRRTLSYKQLDRLANRFAEGLRKQGVRQGDRVLILLPNIPQAVIAYFATLKLGAVVVFMEPTAKTEAVLSRIHHVQATAVLALTGRYDDLHDQAISAGAQLVVFTTLREYMHLYDWLRFTLQAYDKAGSRMPYQRKLVTGRTVFRFKELLALKTERPEPEPEVQSLAMIQFTSGITNDRPSAVQLTHGNLMANALQIRHWLPESRPGDERILAAWPFAAGLSATINLAPLLGATVILMPHFDAMQMLQLIKRYRPTFLPGSPHIYKLLSEIPNIRKYGMASIRVCVSGGASLPIEVQEGFEKVTRGRLVEAYNTGEAGVCIANPLAARKRLGAIGVPLPDVTVRIVHPDTGADCSVGEVGELWLQGPQISQRYWPQPDQESNSHRLQDGWFVSGDLAKQDDDGFLYLIDRAENVIHHGIDHGLVDIYPREIEEVLYELQDVSEAAVTPWANAQGDIEIVAFVVARQSSTLDVEQLRQWCSSRLSPASRPSRFICIDKLPRSATGKVLRRQLLTFLDSPVDPSATGLRK